MPASFGRQLSALIWKNYLIKKHNRIETLVEVLLPLILSALIIIVEIIMKSQGASHELKNLFLENVLMRAGIFLLSGNCCRFILNKVVKEKHLGISRSLASMNTSLAAQGLSFIIIQQPLCLLTSVLETLILCFLKETDSVLIWLEFLGVSLLACESLLLFSLILTLFFTDPKRSTQIGFMILTLTLIPYQVVIETNATYPYVFWMLCWTPATAPLLWILGTLEYKFSDPRIIGPTLGIPFVYFMIYLYFEHVQTYQKSYFFLCLRRRGRRSGVESAIFHEGERLMDGQEQTGSTTIVQMSNVTKSYRRQKVLKQVSFELKAGQTTCLIGNNGSGKTTLINVLVGFTKPEEGEALVCGHSILEEVSAVRENVRLCQQFDFLFEELTPLEHLKLAQMLLGNLCDAQKIADLRQGLAVCEKTLNSPVENLSGGQKRQLSIAMSLVDTRARVLILDEPTARLDLSAKSAVWRYISGEAAKRSDLAVLITTQTVEEAEYLADQVIVLKNGEVLKQGTPKEIRKEFCHEFKVTFSVPQDLQSSLKMQSMVNDRGEEVADKFEEVRELAKQKLQGFQEDFASYGIKEKICFNFQAEHYQTLHSFISDLTSQYSQFQIDIESNKLEQAYINMFQDRNSLDQSRKKATQSGLNAAIQKPSESFNMATNFMDEISTFANKPINKVPSFIIDEEVSQIKAFRVLLSLHFSSILKRDRVPLLGLIAFLIVLIPIYSKVFVNFYVNHDNLMLGMLSGLMLNQHFKFEHNQKRHMLGLLGVRAGAYYASFFVIHYTYFLVFSGYIAIRVQFWDDDQYNKVVYICSRSVVGLSLIPLMYLMGHFLKRTKNAEMYTVLILYLFSWLLYNSFIVFEQQIYETLYHGFPSCIIFYLIFLNPFIYVIELTTMSYKLTNDHIPDPDVHLALSTCFQVLMGIIAWWLLIYLSRREQRLKMTPEVQGEAEVARPMSEVQRKQLTMEDAEMLYQKHEDAEGSEKQGAVKAEGLEKVYPKGKVHAVRGVSFNLSKVLAVVGPNGAGKTTLHSMLNFLKRRTKGKLQILGIENEGELNNAITKSAIVPQEDLFWERLTVQENLELIAQLKGYPFHKAQLLINDLKENLDLKSYENLQADVLSGGCKRKLCFALAMLTQPKLLLLDEPTRGLDPLSRRELYTFLRYHSSHMATLIITQNFEDTEEACDKVAIMANGKFLKFDTPQALIQSQSEGNLLIVEINPAYQPRLSQIPEESDDYSDLSSSSLKEKRPTSLREKEAESQFGAIKAQIARQVLDRMAFCQEVKTKPTKYRYSQNSEKLMIFNFNNIDSYNQASFFATEAGALGKIWHVFKECMALVRDGAILDFQIEKASLDQVYEKLIYQSNNPLE